MLRFQIRHSDVAVPEPASFDLGLICHVVYGAICVVVIGVPEDGKMFIVDSVMAARPAHVVGYYVDHEIHATRVQGGGERFEIIGGSKIWVHGVQVSLVIAVICLRDLSGYR
jgi:hypothetical protein